MPRLIIRSQTDVLTDPYYRNSPLLKGKPHKIIITLAPPPLNYFEVLLDSGIKETILVNFSEYISLILLIIPIAIHEK